MISSAVQAAGGNVENISPEAFIEFNIYIKGVEILGNGAYRVTNCRLVSMCD